VHDGFVTRAESPADLRHCIKCGREVGPDESICEFCNRAGMAVPSASQYHGTVVVAIVLAVAALAVAASLSMRGVGPYSAHVADVGPGDPIGYAITIDVHNDGTSGGRAKCQVVTFDDSGRRLRTANTVTEQLAGGASTSVTVSIPGLEEEPARVTVACS
jgi:hypothetical protein